MEDKSIPDAQVVIQDGSEGRLDNYVVGTAPRFMRGNTGAVRALGICRVLVAVIWGFCEHRCYFPSSKLDIGSVDRFGSAVLFVSTFYERLVRNAMPILISPIPRVLTVTKIGE
jgi:hypothetical protein